MTWLWISLVVLVVAASVVLIGGAMVPREHEATVERELPADAGRVFDLLTGFDRATGWRSGLKKLEVLDPAPGGAPRVREHSGFGVMTFVFPEVERPRRLVSVIEEQDLGFGGRWIFELEAQGDDRCRLRITEDGHIDSVLFRFLTHYVFGYDKTLNTYLADVDRALRQPG